MIGKLATAIALSSLISQTKCQKKCSLWWVCNTRQFMKICLWLFFSFYHSHSFCLRGGKKVFFFPRAKVVWCLFISSKRTAVFLNHFLRRPQFFPQHTHTYCLGTKNAHSNISTLNLLTTPCALALTSMKQLQPQFHLLLLKYGLV